MTILDRHVATVDERQPSSLATVGALIGDPVRAAMLVHLSGGNRYSAGDLAGVAGVSPQAASAHLARLVDGGFLAVEKSGRHRLFRLASGEVAEMIEAVSNWADRAPTRRRIDPALCRGRFCYDHLAGKLGVGIYDAMAAQGFLCLGADGPVLSAAGTAWCASHRVDMALPPRSRRPSVRLCLDWTERRHHLGGHLGAALALMMVDRGFVRRRPEERIADLTPPGAAFLRQSLGVAL